MRSLPARQAEPGGAPPPPSKPLTCGQHHPGQVSQQLRLPRDPHRRARSSCRMARSLWAFGAGSDGKAAEMGPPRPAPAEVGLRCSGRLPQEGLRSL